MIGVIGDLHFKSNLSYSKHIEDKRENEENEILDFIVSSLSDCDKIVILGDMLNSKNSSAKTISKLVKFIERFNGKEVYIISGNHTKNGDGTTAIDFLSEVKNTKWNIFTRGIATVGNIDFLPYLTNSELEIDNIKDATKYVMDNLNGNDMLFAHHTISNFATSSGVKTCTFDEIVLPKDKLESKYKLIVAGHIHKYSKRGKTIILGSVFNQEVNETQKYILKINEEDLSTETIELPGRKIYGITDPTVEELNKLEESSIVKVILTDKNINKNDIKEAIQRFEARIYIERYPREREMVDIDGGNILDLPIEKLLELYAKKNKLDMDIIKKAYTLIK